MKWPSYVVNSAMQCLPEVRPALPRTQIKRGFSSRIFRLIRLKSIRAARFARDAKVETCNDVFNKFLADSEHRVSMDDMALSSLTLALRKRAIRDSGQIPSGLIEDAVALGAASGSHMRGDTKYVCDTEEPS